MPKGDWHFSFDEETYWPDGYDTREEAIRAAKEFSDKDRPFVFIGREGRIKASENFNFESLIETIQENAAEEVSKKDG